MLLIGMEKQHNREIYNGTNFSEVADLIEPQDTSRVGLSKTQPIQDIWWISRLAPLNPAYFPNMRISY